MRPASASPQFGLMAHIAAAGDDTIGALAERVGLDQSTLSRNLRGLEQAGLVEITLVETDLRRRAVWLTENGARRLEAAIPAWRRAHEALAADRRTERCSADRGGEPRVARYGAGLDKGPRLKSGEGFCRRVAQAPSEAAFRALKHGLANSSNFPYSCKSFAIAGSSPMDARVAEAPVSATLNSWRRERGDPSLSEVHRSIAVAAHGTPWRKFAAFLGPGYLVAVGYMDPGNWATSLAGGSKFGYALLFIALMSNIMAIVLQASVRPPRRSRPGATSRRPAATPIPRRSSWPLWLLAEIAICATDLAEVIGTAIGLNLLFGIPLEIGVLITGARRVPDPVAAEQGLPLDRGLHHHAARRDRGLLRGPDRAGRPGLGRGHPRLRADDARSSPTRTCSTSRSASSARR